MKTKSRVIRYVMNHKFNCITAVLGIIYCICIWHADDVQQMKLWYLKQGYDQLAVGSYSEALDSFHMYYDQRSDIFWWLSRKFASPEQQKSAIEYAMQQ